LGPKKEKTSNQKIAQVIRGITRGPRGFTAMEINEGTFLNVNVDDTGTAER
jgi:hypothetical protein